MSSEGEHLFRFPIIKLPNSRTVRSVMVYIAGALYAIGFWLVVDASVYSKTVNASVVHVTFVDWIPFICSTLGMMVINSIDKGQLFNSEGFGSGLQWQARLVLFVGFSLLAVGIAGGFLVLILKFLIKGFNSMPTLGMGLENVGANFCVMLSCILLWIIQNIEEDQTLSL
ncbi:DEKNAAC102699 [Brettanomyces naardenensis]|uniref:DEKNAAC102699 n=1 Tax=Brettanomyces naardenensis TaxID=13370 RepID=A0A448YKU6_BRENA|nr:DEKNAAC102699 [Brettanomyces naardenensis]